jgi:23S rRNA (guanine745-N1)-methyltransferase
MEKFIPEILRGSPYPVHCPLCKANLNINNSTVTCLNGHQFGTDASEYINLRSTSVYPVTNAQWLIIQRSLTETGIINQLERELLPILHGEYAINNTLTILDAGTGESNLFRNILLCLRWDQYRHQGIGLYYSKPALNNAALQNHHAIWLMADIAKLPLKDCSVDVILNTLSPSSYKEFNRILKPGGLIMKTVPVTDSAEELRRLVHHQGYSHEGTVQVSNQITILCVRKEW